MTIVLLSVIISPTLSYFIVQKNEKLLNQIEAKIPERFKPLTYEAFEYANEILVQKIVQENRNKIKNIISNKTALLPDAIPFGTATEIQKNELMETLNFLTHLTI